MKRNNLGSGIFTIDNFLSSQESNHFISIGNDLGFGDAPIQTSNGEQLFKSIRNNDRVIFDDIDLSEKLFSRAVEFLPDTFDIFWKAIGFNERFRLYRYTENQYFKWHKDGEFVKSPNEVSKLSFIIYLNDEYNGGETEFQSSVYKPVTGSALVFPHKLLHQGAVVVDGTKYVLRTDVMFRRLA